MPCPSCDSERFGATFDPRTQTVVRGCGDCGYAEEASPSEVALFEEDHALSAADAA